MHVHHYRFRFASARSGMTLLNIIMLLVLFGALVMAGYALMGPLIARGKITDTKRTINSAVEAVISWSVAQGRLPTTAEFQAIFPNPYDAWGKPLVYLYDQSLANTATGGGLCGRITTNLSESSISMAFAVVSGGDDYSIQTTMNGTTVTVSTAITALTTLASYQTDLYRMIPLEELKSRAGCYGATGGRLMIINNELPRTCSGGQYHATLYAAGGAPSPAGQYRWCINGVMPGSIIAKGGTETIPGCPTFSTGTYQNIQLSGTAPIPTATTEYPITVRVQDSDISNASPPYVERRLSIKTIVGGVCSTSTGPGVIPPGTTPDTPVQDPSNPGFNTSDPSLIEFGLNNNNTSACVWYPQNLPLPGKTMRAYWHFCYSGIDTSGTSSNLADGYTFTLMQANNPTSYCGTGSSYNAITNPRYDCSVWGGLGEYLAYCGLPGNSMALEFDIYPSGSRNDPAGSYNHVAVVNGFSHTSGTLTGLFSDNTHNSGSNPACTTTSSGCLYDNKTGQNYPVSWLENTGCNATYDNHNARVELHTRCNSDCSQCETNSCTTKALIKLWIDRGNSNLDANDTTTPDMSYCTDLPTALSQYKVGFTEATGGAHQWGYIKNFALKSLGSCPLATISPSSLPPGTVGTAYSATLSASGGTAPYSNWRWSSASIGGITASNLPPGLSLSSAGVISGTPTTAGTYNTVLVSVDDACTADKCSNTVSRSYTITIVPAPVPSCTLSASPTTVAYGGTTTFNWTISNGPANGSWSIAPGGTCSDFTGSTGGSCTSGSLTSPGTTIYTLTVSNAGGSSNCSATVKVGCGSYRVWNSTGSTYDFIINGVCRNNVGNGSEISSGTNLLSPGQRVYRYQRNLGNCGGSALGSIDFTAAQTADTDEQCDINYGSGDQASDH